MLLNGMYSNNSMDTSGKNFWSNFENDTLLNYSDYKVTVTPSGLNTLKLKLYYEDSVVRILMLGGKYKNGYFITEREWITQPLAGPFMWFLNNNIRYIGLDKNNNLVVLNSGRKLLVMVMLLPIASTKVQYENKYKRIKK